VRAEEALKQAHDNLENRIQQRTTELIMVNEKLKAEIEERKRTESALRESEALLKEAQGIAHLGSFDRNLLTGEGVWSDETYRTFGYIPGEVVPGFDLFLTHVHPDDRSRVAVEYKTLVADGEPVELEFRFRRNDGKVRYVFIRARVECDAQGEVVRYFGTVQDITERKLAEEALRRSKEELKFLSSKLLSAQEEERKRISRDVHDSIGTALTGIKMNLENTRSHMDKGKVSPDFFQNLISMVQQAMRECRRIMTDLRPSLLDDLGISVTVDWLCDQFQVLSPGISIKKEVKINEARVPDALKTTIFRIIQEGLSNVSKHSGGDSVSISLLQRRGFINLEIIDNGKGFDLDKTLYTRGDNGGLGLTSMRERAELAGGSLSIDSTIGVGTVIRASWST
jgi:PAS domain S-box-containing protein